MKNKVIAIFTLLLFTHIGSAIADDTTTLQAKIDKLQAQVDANKAERVVTDNHLKIFDELDLVAFNKRDITRI